MTPQGLPYTICLEYLLTPLNNISFYVHWLSAEHLFSDFLNKSLRRSYFWKVAQISAIKSSLVFLTFEHVDVKTPSRSGEFSPAYELIYFDLTRITSCQLVNSLVLPFEADPTWNGDQSAKMFRKPQDNYSWTRLVELFASSVVGGGIERANEELYLEDASITIKVRETSLFDRLLSDYNLQQNLGE